MSTFAVGQKVETPFGNGEVVALGSEFNGVESYRVRFALPKDENGYLHPVVEFPNYHLKPYKTPHERLLETGFEVYAKYNDSIIYFNKKTEQYIKIDKLFIAYRVYFGDEKGIYRPNNVILELSRTLTDYLEWLEEEK